MLTGWRYRVVGTMGTVSLIVGAVLLANHPVPQSVVTTYVPLFNRLEPQILDASALVRAIALSVLFVGGALVPLYKPQPRRVLDVVFLAQKRVLVGGLALAALGYFNYSYRLPRQTLVLVVGALGIAIPAWFVWIRRQPRGKTGRTLIVGDDLSQIHQVVPAVESSVLGYLSPSIVASARGRDMDEVVTDGGVSDGGVAFEYAEAGVATVEEETSADGVEPELERLGGLSRLEDALVAYDVDTVVLAFRRADRAEFFGALDACHDHGVSAKVHREYADSVLVSEGDVGELVEVDLEPWDPIDHVGKRLFDIAFASAGLLIFAPFFLLIGLAIKLDSPGPVFYSQDRTAGFGETFPVYKFRSMLPESEDTNPGEEENRITRVGEFLRKTHLDELPQLWSIFVGDMSVVGPRAAWTEEERILENDVPTWRKRWFVKPGLTGLAQINDAKSTDPSLKLRYDLEYIRRQSVWFDVKIVIRQIWKVLEDVVETVRG